MKLAPVVLFAYNRPWHLRQAIESLQKNELSGESDLIVYSDGPQNFREQSKVDAVRQYICSIKGFRSIEVFESSTNRGLANSIIAGVSATLERFDEIIVLEDDLVTAPFFLRYMNDALNLYKTEEKVISIHGYTYPVSKRFPETFFLQGADCWGWATWKRGWLLFEENGEKLLEELRSKKLTKLFDYNGACRYTRMLRRQTSGEISSWAIRWYASAFLLGHLTLYPGASLVKHIGNDGTGTNIGNNKSSNVELSGKAISVELIDIVENLVARKIVEDYLRSVKTPIAKGIVNYAKRYFKSKFLMKNE